MLTQIVLPVSQYVSLNYQQNKQIIFVYDLNDKYNHNINSKTLPVPSELLITFVLYCYIKCCYFGIRWDRRLTCEIYFSRFNIQRDSSCRQYIHCQFFLSADTFDLSQTHGYNTDVFCNKFRIPYYASHIDFAFVISNVIKRYIRHTLSKQSKVRCIDFYKVETRTFNGRIYVPCLLRICVAVLYARRCIHSLLHYSSV